MASLIASRSSLGKVLASSICRGNLQGRPFSSVSPWALDDQPAQDFSDIPGPKRSLLFGNVLKYYLGKYPLESLPSVYERYFQEYGPLVKEHVYRGRTLVHVFDPMDMNKIYFLDRSVLPNRITLGALADYRLENLELYRSAGLTSLNGKPWSDLRRAFGDKFLNERSNEAFEQITEDLMARIGSKISGGNNEVDLLPILYDWSLECMGAVALGQRLDCLIEFPDERLRNMIRCINVSQKSLLHTENMPRMFTRKHAKHLAECQHYVHKTIWQRVEKVIKSIMETKEEDLAKDGGPIAPHNSVVHTLLKKELEHREIATLITDMFQGGIHSTAHILAFALYYLAINPTVQKSVRDSLMETFPSRSDKISSKPLDKTVKNVIRETMRLNPPTIGTGRILTEPLVLSNYKVPQNTMCILHHQIASKNKNYFANPHDFIPDRFNNPTPSKSAIVANSPFSMGKRECPGRLVALNEIAIGLSKILRLYEVSYKYERVGTKNVVINEPDKEIKVTFKPTTV